MLESEMIDDIEREYRYLSPVEFVEEYNRIFGTTLTINDIIWDDVKNNRS